MDQDSTKSLEQAIAQGEYEPKFLAQFPVWTNMSKHRQFQYIREGLQGREKQIAQQWAEINNILDFSKKPHLKDALRNLENQLQKLKEDKERLYVLYSS